MNRNCYVVEMYSALDGLFEQLDNYGFDYECKVDLPVLDYMEIYVWYYPDEIWDLQNIFAPYV